MDVGKEGIGIQGHPCQARLRQNTTLTKHTKTSVHYQGNTLANIASRGSLGNIIALIVY